jgi:protein-disulfide isomerase
MSQRNSQEAKRAARDRLRVERERQAKKDKARRQAFVGLAVVAVLVIAGGIAFAVSKMGGDDGGSSSDKPLVKPANTSGKDGTDVVIGKSGAKHTLSLYEDPRCPICAQFEQSAGDTVIKGMKDGTYKLDYTYGTFIDGNSGGSGSKNALSALGAALNVSTDAYLDFHKALYSKANHPEETSDSFKDDSYLLKIADGVPALKGNAKFEKAVKNGTYDTWAAKMSQKFNKSGVSGTPALKFDGKALTTDGKNPPMTAQQFTQVLDKAMK